MSPGNTPTYRIATSRNVSYHWQDSLFQGLTMPSVKKFFLIYYLNFPLVQPEAISSHPTSCFLGEEFNIHLPAIFQMFVQSRKREMYLSGLSDCNWPWKDHGLGMSVPTWKELWFSVSYHGTWSGIETGCPRKCYNHHPCMCLKGMWMWHLGVWFSGGHSGVGLTVGLDYLASVLQS